MIEIYEYFDNAGYNERKPRENWLHDYYIANTNEIFRAHYSHPAIHIWLSHEGDWWHVQFAKAPKVENIVKPQFRGTIKRIHSLPKGVMDRIRWLIEAIFVDNNYEVSKALADKWMQKASGDSSSVDDTFFE
jgi:hypothetical protein